MKTGGEEEQGVPGLTGWYALSLDPDVFLVSSE